MTDIREQIRIANVSLSPSADEFFPGNKISSIPQGATSSGFKKISEHQSTSRDDESFSSEYDSYEDESEPYSSQDESDEDDHILNDMLKKSKGQDPNRLNIDSCRRETIKYCDESDDEDPNETHIFSSPKYSVREQIFPKHSLGELENMLEEDPETYKRCRIHKKAWYLAEAVQLSEHGNETRETVVILDGKDKIGRTFNNDEVVVKVEQSNGRKTGQVMGILKRHKNLKEWHFLCRPDDANLAIMGPIERACTKFVIRTPKNHRDVNPGTIPLYKTVHKRPHFTHLELVSCEKVQVECLYKVKYLKWSEYSLYPLGYVEEAVQISNLEECMRDEFGAGSTAKPSIEEQIRKTKIPEVDSKDIIPIFTIDPQGTKDIDDGLNLTLCEEHYNCYIVGIHITDVASLLPEDSPIDCVAKEKKDTIHEADLHILPQKFRATKLSLLQNKCRHAISTFFHSSIRPPHIYRTDRYIQPKKTFVMSRKQLTYKKAEEILRSDDDPSDLESIEFQLKKIWEILWGWRNSRLDSAAYFQDENYDKIIAEGRARLLIEEAMVAANANAANYLVSMGCKFQLKVHALPSLKRWEEWANSNKSAIQHSAYLSSSSKYIKSKHDDKRKFYRIRESFRSPESEGQGSSSVAGNSSNNSPVTERHSDPGLCKEDPEIYESVWTDIKKCIEDGNIFTALMILSLDHLHPSHVSALDQYYDILKRSRWNSSDTDDALHCSLRLYRYTRCTSPMRRYEDIVIQRCIIKAIEKKRPPQNIDCFFKDNKKLMIKFEVAQFAKKLEKQPVVQDVCISMITDAGLKIFFPSRHDYLPTRIRRLDFGHLMLDLDNMDFEKLVKRTAKKNCKTNKYGDLILHELPAKWKCRFYNYQKSISEESIRNHASGVSADGPTIKIPKEDWQDLIGVMSSLPGKSSSQSDREAYCIKVTKAIKELPFRKLKPSLQDEMCGKTRNKPKEIYHHREIKKTLKTGSVMKIQLSGWLGRDQLLEPCVQLLALAEDFSICVHHNHEPLLVFARDAKVKDRMPETLQEYHEGWEPLIRMDSAYNAVTDGSSVVLSDLKIKWNTTTSSSAEAKMANSSECEVLMNKHEFNMQSKFCKDRYLEIHKNDLLCLRLPGIRNSEEPSMNSFGNSGMHTIVLHGSVSDVNNDDEANKKSKTTIFFKLFMQRIPDVSLFRNAENLWTIEVIPLSFMHRHIQKSMSMLTKTKNKLIKNIALRTTIDVNCIGNLPRAAKYLIPQRQYPGFPYELNDRQQEEKNRSIEQKFTVIQGPPGTGKSFLGAQIAANFAEINQKKYPKEKKKVLYCGPSNKAVDVAAKFLKNAEGLKVVRMYSAMLEDKMYPNPLKPPPVMEKLADETKKPDPNLESVALHELIRAHGKEWSDEITAFDARVKNPFQKFTREEVDAYKKTVNKAKQHELQSCDIIICTCSLAAQLTQFNDKKEQEIKFAQCIIDECGMCSEPETMVPLIASNPEQVVLIGDHKQLQPVIKCKKAERLGLGESLFSKYSKFAGMLTVQYRMDAEIMETPSQMFYKGKLRADQSISLRKQTSFFDVTKYNNVFWHVEGIEKELKFRSARGGHKSKYNLKEAETVVKLLKYLTIGAKAKLAPSEIMILSPYTAQCTKIQNLIKTTSLKNKVHVGSVVTSQGSEAKFVILSMVRSLPIRHIREKHGVHWEKTHLGFICDPHQVNVALTRAQRGLCIIGNKHLLSSNANWETIIQSYEVRRAVYGNDLIDGSSWAFRYLPSDSDTAFFDDYDFDEESESDDESSRSSDEFSDQFITERFR